MASIEQASALLRPANVVFFAPAGIPALPKAAFLPTRESS